MTFLIFIPRLLCPLLTSGQNESGLCGDQWTPLQPPFSAASSFIFLSQPFFLCISVFLSLVFHSVFPLLPLVFFSISFYLFSLPHLSFFSLSALICSFLLVVPPAGFLHQPHSPTYLSLPLLICAAQPLCLSLLTFLIHSALCNTDVPPDLFGLFSAVCY